MCPKGTPLRKEMKAKLRRARLGKRLTTTTRRRLSEAHQRSRSLAVDRAMRLPCRRGRRGQNAHDAGAGHTGDSLPADAGVVVCVRRRRGRHRVASSGPAIARGLGCDADATREIGCAALMATAGKTVEYLLKQDQELGESAFALLQEVVQRLERHRAAAVDTRH